PAPARLVHAAGVRYDEFSNLDRPVALRHTPGGPLDLPDGATATRWVDGLTVVDADVLVAYDHPHFGRWPAVTTRCHGTGRITYVGTVPGRDLARCLAGWLAPNPASGWRSLPPSVTAATATSPNGDRVHVVHNWSWQPARISAPTYLSEVTGHGRLIQAGAPLDLGPWDVQVYSTATDDFPGRPK
ncbi:beta-galactosidase, partial [Micromonospora sp. KC207]|uniref:beta-galactosidase trimerization domain-containing protein n=1 Tax=Micromonospora sp. KC207 TaxID=2530377 RepID=UPI0010F37FBE